MRRAFLPPLVLVISVLFPQGSAPQTNGLADQFGFRLPARISVHLETDGSALKAAQTPPGWVRAQVVADSGRFLETEWFTPHTNAAQ